MIMTQINHKSELRSLILRKKQLREKLWEHFSLPISERNYQDFDSVVDELDALRKKISELLK